MLEVVFWLAAALIVYTHAGYPLLLLALARLKPPQRFPDAPAPSVSVIVAAVVDNLNLLRRRSPPNTEASGEYPTRRGPTATGPNGSATGLCSG